VKAGSHRAPMPPQPDAAQWRMLCAIVCDTVAAARRHGGQTATFGGYRIAARRIDRSGAHAVALTIGLAQRADASGVFGADGPPLAVRTAVALPAVPDAASVIAWRCPCGQAVCAQAPTAG